MNEAASELEVLRLAFWRERLQAAGNLCRGGAQRGEALLEIQSLEQAIAALGQQAGESPHGQ